VDYLHRFCGCLSKTTGVCNQFRQPDSFPENEAGRLADGADYDHTRLLFVTFSCAILCLTLRVD
jgi:hypothetical protein